MQQSVDRACAGTPAGCLGVSATVTIPDHIHSWRFSAVTGTSAPPGMRSIVLVVPNSTISFNPCKPNQLLTLFSDGEVESELFRFWVVFQD